MRWILLMLVGLSVAGCATTVMRATISPADIEAASTMLERGSGTVTGSALLRQRGGGVVTCAGNDVFLIPSTESTSRELQRIFGSEQGYVQRGGRDALIGEGGGMLVAPPEPNRRAVCNPQGFFNFPAVRPGKWHVMTAVVWRVGDNYQGGTLLATVEVAEGQEVEVVLTH